MNKVLLWGSLILLASCGQHLGTRSAEEVAMLFLSGVYSLRLDQVSSLVSDDALLQVAVLEGRTELMTASERTAYTTSNITIMQTQFSNNNKHATISYQVQFLDTRTTTNQLELAKVKQSWQVVRIHYPLISGNIYDY